jgi:beta-galactosidase/beta-glucuronidase
VLFCAGPVFSQKTQRFYLSGKDKDNTVDWEFYCTGGCDSGYWTTIPVPSNWECEGFGTYNYGQDAVESCGKEEGMYRYKFHVPAEWKSKTVKIVFECSMTDTEVKINGRSAGEIHQGVFYQFDYNISDILLFGDENLLEVAVSKHSANESINETERKCDYWIFGGIFRPVYLAVKPREHIERVEIDAKADGTFRLNAFVQNIEEANQAEIRIRTLNGKTIGSPFTKRDQPGTF